MVARLHTVPNQPLRFSDENRTRVEDEILAYSFDKFLSGEDEEWPALLPMVKSAVRAMDVIQELVVDETEGVSAVEDFTVYGTSKRGWTTWLTAAVDTRVRAIVPTVFDFLNLETQFPHHKAFYEGVSDHIVGDYSSVMHDYVDSNVVARMGTPLGEELQDIADPYRYRDRYESIPKLLINATGDEFFVPDGSQLYFDDLPGEKFLRYVPNANHSGYFFEVAVQFHQAVTAEVDLPEFDWSIEDGGRRIKVTTRDTPLEVRMFEAHNPNAKDFRHSISTPPPVWQATLLTDLGDGLYVAELPYPESGASAFMIELAFENEGEAPYRFTTDVSVIVPSSTTGDFDSDGSYGVGDVNMMLTAIKNRDL